jgi:hypothetical protein
MVAMVQTRIDGGSAAACINCRFSRPIEGSEVLHCRRHAPLADPDPMRLAKFPRVTAADWCGEYARAQAKE